jgi:hypothetical protein
MPHARPMHGQLAIVGDLDRGVLVDPDSDEVGRGGDDRHQAAVPLTLGEVLVDDDAVEQAEPVA